MGNSEKSCLVGEKFSLAGRGNLHFFFQACHLSVLYEVIKIEFHLKVMYSLLEIIN